MIEVKWSEVFSILELSEKCGQTLSWDLDVSSQLKLNGEWRNQIIKKIIRYPNLMVIISFVKVGEFY